jgi:hypothetical protein
MISFDARLVLTDARSATIACARIEFAIVAVLSFNA